MPEWKTVVQAKIDFTVGPSKEVVIYKGELRVVELDKHNQFTTITRKGTFFGVCHTANGWKVLGKVPV
jgi:hypothetical protein